MAIKINDKYIKPVWKNSPLITGNTRSEPQKIYRPNGIYLSDTKMFKKTKNFLSKKD